MADAENAPETKPDVPATSVEEQKPNDGGGDAPAEGEGEAQPEKPTMAFDDFDFGERKKKKKPKKAAAKIVARPTKKQYEDTIADLNGVLAQLRRKGSKLDEVNLKKSQMLVETKERDVEVSEYLKREKAKRTQSLIYEEEYLVEINKKIKELDERSNAKIKELSNDFSKTEKQFLGEIEMLKYKFGTLCTFADGDDAVLQKMFDLEREFKKSEQTFRNRLYEIQKRNVVIRKNADDEAKTQFNRIIDDFTRSREVRSAAYTRRLLSENSSLRRAYNKLIPINLKKETELTRLMEKTSTVRDTHIIVSDITKRLEMTDAKRDELLDKLQKKYETYKLQVITASKYRRMFEIVKEYENKQLSKYQNAEVLAVDIGDYVEALHGKIRALREAENEYTYQRQQYDLFVESVKDATFSICGLPQYDKFYPKSFGEYVAKRDGMIRGLVDLLTSTDRKLDSRAFLKSKYYKGYLGLMPLDFAMCRTLLEECHQIYAGLKWVPSFCKLSTKFSTCHEEEEQEVETSKSNDPALLCEKYSGRST